MSSKFTLFCLLLLGGLGRAGADAPAALEPPLQQLRERAQRCYDAGDTERGHQALAELVAALPGRVELAAELLGTMRRASMADKRMNRWTAYATERLVALHQAGLLDESNPEVLDAYDCLCVVRWDQGRLWESWDLLQRLQALDPDNPYARLGAVRLLAQVESAATIPTMQSVLDAVDGSRNDDRTREFLMVADRILSEAWPWAHTSILDPWRPVFSRAKFVGQSNQQMLDDLKAALARRRADQAAPAPAIRPSAPRPQPAGVSVPPVPDILSPAWSDLAGQEPDKNPELFDRAIRVAAGADKPALTADGLGLLDPVRAIDLRLRQMNTAAVSALRQVQETQYQERIRLRTPAQRAGREALGWYRQSPWSPTANRDLLARAQADLQRGRIAAARRSFGDILQHALEPATRQAAQVGLWLAAASEGQPAALDTLFADVDPTALFPWMGRTETAANIKARLLQGMPAEDRDQPKLAELEPRWLRLPAVPVWPDDTLTIQHGASLVEVQVRGNRIMAGARRWLAWYDLADPSAPLWFASDPALAPNPPGELQLPGAWRPALAGGRLYIRAGEASVPAQVRALDVENGRTLWETVGALPPPPTNSASSEFHAVCADPVIAGACLYYTELVGNKANPGDSRWDIVCAAADDGALIWRSTVVDAGADTVAGRLFRELPLAVRQRGNPLTVADGALFFGHAGLAARLDARDGRVEWVRTCRHGMAVAALRAGLAASRGAAPLVAGERVLLLARDGAALFAADRQTGQLLWEQIFIQPLELLGATKDRAVVRTVNRLVGVALDTGAVQWDVPAPEIIVGRGSVHGEVITLAAGDALLSLNAADGAVRERRAWPEGKAVWDYALAGKTLVLATDETAPTAAYKPDTLLNPNGSAEKPGPLGLPFKHAWDLPCAQRTRFFASPAGSPLQGRLFVAADGMLEAIDLDARGRSAWRRFTMGTVGQILFDKTTLVLCSGADPNQSGVQAVMAINGQTGAVLWRLPVWRSTAGVALSDGVFAMYDADAELRAYDAATGRPLWDRLVLRNTNMNARTWMTPPLAQAGQLHLFGARLQPAWEPGIPYSRFELRTGDLLPLRWIAKGESNQINRAQYCVGAKQAFVQIEIRKRDAPPQLYQCVLAEGGATRELSRSERMWPIGGPYVVVGKDNEQERKLFNCDDPAYEYPLDMRNLVMLTEELLLLNEKDGVAIIDLEKKQRIIGINTAADKIGNPRILKLDDTRVLFHGVSEKTIEKTVEKTVEKMIEKTLVVQEVDRRTGQVTRQGRVPDFDVNRNELRGVFLVPTLRQEGSGPPPGNVLLLQDNRALHAYVTAAPPPAAPPTAAP